MNVKRFTMGLLALCCLFSLGCIRSIYPIYLPDEGVFEEKLLGEWVILGNSSDEPRYPPTEEALAESPVWTFTREDGQNGYLVELDEKLEGKEPFLFKGTLIQIKGHYFLDLQLDSYPEEAPHFQRLHMLPLHSFYHLPSLEPPLRFEIFDMDVLSEELEENPNLLPLLPRDSVGDLVTAVPTKKLRKALIYWIKNEKPWTPLLRFDRAANVKEKLKLEAVEAEQPTEEAGKNN
ncbi:Hypothetical protein PBC10988_30330 [Planctomycetales bacterium 10988]|nr:Hypothetical protein PBC10988_30330 [Planctomycetales bacterium 10988]